MLLNSSPERCGVVPMPAEPKWTLPGLLLAYAISSWTFLAGMPGCTINTIGVSAKVPIATKSLAGSNGRPLV